MNGLLQKELCTTSLLLVLQKNPLYLKPPATLVPECHRIFFFEKIGRHHGYGTVHTNNA